MNSARVSDVVATVERVLSTPMTTIIGRGDKFMCVVRDGKPVAHVYVTENRIRVVSCIPKKFNASALLFSSQSMPRAVSLESRFKISVTLHIDAKVEHAKMLGDVERCMRAVLARLG